MQRASSERLEVNAGSELSNFAPAGEVALAEGTGQTFVMNEPTSGRCDAVDCLLNAGQRCQQGPDRERPAGVMDVRTTRDYATGLVVRHSAQHPREVVRNESAALRSCLTQL